MQELLSIESVDRLRAQPMQILERNTDSLHRLTVQRSAAKVNQSPQAGQMHEAVAIGKQSRHNRTCSHGMFLLESLRINNKKDQRHASRTSAFDSNTTPLTAK